MENGKKATLLKYINNEWLKFDDKQSFTYGDVAYLLKLFIVKIK